MTKIHKLLVALVVAAGTAGAMTAPALAAGWDHQRDVRGHDWRDHHRAFYPAPYAYVAPSYGYAAPTYGYAPSYGYAPAYGYAPPPVAYAPPALSFNLNLPIR